MPDLKQIIIDEELSQSKARLAISELSLFFFLAVGKLRQQEHSETISDSLITIVTYLAFSLCWYFLVKHYPQRAQWRRYISMATDLAIMTIFFHIGGKNSSVVYPLFLWIIIGNGIRFGERYLSTGIILGSLGFGSIVMWAPFWNENLELSAGLLTGVVVLPIFFFSVLKRLKAITMLEVELNKSRLADRAKDDFLATMSHELRTPMNGVLGMAESLRESPLNTNQKEQVHVITRSVESLLHIINDILDYSKIAAQKLTLENDVFDLKQILTDVHILMESTAKEKGLTLEYSYPEDGHQYFRGDAIRIRQMAFNLLGNAIKFTNHGHIKLNCNLEPGKESTLVSISVQDTGIGIPASRQAAIFGHFEQADGSTTRLYEGAGLGLSISRQLARMMGGDIDVISEEGLGSKFTASVRLKKENPPIVKNTPKTEAMHQTTDFKLHALVVEDNKFNQVVVLNMLKKIGVSCLVAENGQEALDMIDKSNFDLVIMDVRMPIMNGYEATKAIRARNDQLANIPILALTGEATKNDVAQCLASGMNLHLSKPVRLAVLVESIKALCIEEALTN